MYIREIEFRNVGRHRYLHLNLQRGLVAIMGPNGVGKSTVTDGIFAATTNDWGRFAGLKTDSINATAAEDEESFIRYVAEHNDVEFEMFRQLRRVKGARGGRKANELVIGSRVIDNDVAIKQELSTRLGVNASLLSAYVFVAQTDLLGFLSQTAGDRAKIYQTLCRTIKAATIEDAISQFLTSDASMTTEVVDNSDELLRIVADLEAKIAETQTERQTAAAGLLNADRLAKAQAIKAKRETWVRVAREAAALKQRIEEREVAIAELEADVADAQTHHAAAKAKAEESDAAAREAQQQLTAILRANTAIEKRKALQKRLAAVVAELALAGEKPQERHPETSNRDDLQMEKGEKTARWRRNREILATFEQEGVVACPTCGTMVSQLDDHLKRLAAENANLEPAIKKLNSLLTLIDACENAAVAYDAKIQRLTADRDGLKTQIKLLVETAPPTGDEKALNEIIDANESNKQLLDRVAQSLAKANSALTAAEARLQGENEQLEGLMATTAENKISDDLFNRVGIVLAAHDKARGTTAVLDERLRAFGAELTQRKTEIDKLAAVLARSHKARRFAAVLGEIQEVMHRQSLPAYVAASNLQDMESDINAALDDFGSPFWVEATEDLSFTVHFPGEPPRSAERLSIGQKGVLAVCFRSAIGQLFDADLGLMCLDEPTSGFDHDNIGYLGESLKKYADKIRGRRQVIVITHADSLRSAFDQVIELGKVA